MGGRAGGPLRSTGHLDPLRGGFGARGPGRLTATTSGAAACAVVSAFGPTSVGPASPSAVRPLARRRRAFGPTSRPASRPLCGPLAVVSGLRPDEASRPASPSAVRAACAALTLRPLEDGRHPLAAADAHRHDAELESRRTRSFASLQGQDRAGRPDRVAERDRAAVGLVFSGSRPASRITATAWEANASFSSTTSMSPGRDAGPARAPWGSRARARSPSARGPSPQTRPGPQPQAPIPRLVASDSRISTTAAAPSLIPDALPAVTVPLSGTPAGVRRGVSRSCRAGMLVAVHGVCRPRRRDRAISSVEAARLDRRAASLRLARRTRPAPRAKRRTSRRRARRSSPSGRCRTGRSASRPSRRRASCEPSR